MKRIVVALGGNAILRAGQEASYENQYGNVEKTAGFLVDLVASGHELVIAHGNGPQVGNLVLQNELTSREIPGLPLYVLSAETQGFIGYMLEESLDKRLEEAGIDKDVITLLTRVEVSKDDPAFKDPTKPIGRFYTEEEYEAIKEEKDWTIKKDANRGYRRVVYSPRPVRILESKTIEELLGLGRLVIAGGGGGIPIVKTDQGYSGIEAVIDKDLTSAAMARDIGADILMILTDVDHACINFGSQDERALGQVTVAEMEAYIREGQFAKGSMLPKVQAAVEFAKTGREAYICSLEKAGQALDGNSGTKVVL